MENTLIKGNVFRKTIWTLITVATFFTAAAQSSRDIKFAKCTYEDGLMEVQLGKLALTKATVNDIKTHAQHMIDDHGKANEELKALAEKKNIPLPKSLGEKKQKYELKIGELNGTEFDKRYIKCMVHAHKKALCSFKKEAKKSKDAELKAWAQGKIPVIESHLSMWKEVCKKNKKS